MKSLIIILVSICTSIVYGFQSISFASRRLHDVVTSQSFQNFKSISRVKTALELERASSNRRDALNVGASAVLTSILIGTENVFALPEYPKDASDKIVLVTGANSGIGYDAVARMAARGCTVLVACRTLQKAEDTVNRISSDLDRTDLKLVPLECDLASLESIRSCASNIPSNKIDVLCLNAGLARDVGSKDVLRTKDGFELTVGTNHLGHFYLTNLLLRENKIESKNGRIVVTASGVHDPDSPGGAQGSLATLGNLEGMSSGPDFEMIDGAPFDPDKAYKDSKLCNVFFTRELQNRLSVLGGENNGIKAYCFNPGLIVGTGLFREQNKIFTTIFDIAATRLLKVGENTHL